MHFVLVLLNMPFSYESKPFMNLRHTDLQYHFIFLCDILFFHYICFQISRLVGLFNIGEPKQKVEFQTEMFPCVFIPYSDNSSIFIQKNTDQTVFF